VSDDRLIDPNRAVDFMIAEAPKYAQAKAERVYLEQFRKSKKALLMKQAGVEGIKTSAAQEVEAYADPAYQELLVALRDATELEENCRWKLVAAQARVEVWRSTEASSRNQDRATR
jgi:hypothetical protein